MSRPRFCRVIEHLRRQEDNLRGEIAEIDRQRSNCEQDIADLVAQRQREAQALSVNLHEQFQAFAFFNNQKQIHIRNLLKDLNERRQSVQDALVALWRRRRSLENLQERQQKAENKQREQRQNAEILDGATRAWYLRSMLDTQAQESPLTVLEGDPVLR